VDGRGIELRCGILDLSIPKWRVLQGRSERWRTPGRQPGEVGKNGSVKGRQASHDCFGAAKQLKTRIPPEWYKPGGWRGLGKAIIFPANAKLFFGQKPAINENAGFLLTMDGPIG